MAGPLDFGPFLRLDEASRARILRDAKRVTFRPRQALVREGETADAVFAVVSGRIRVTQGTPPTIVATPSAPVLVGEMALLAGTTRNATVTAATRVSAYRLAREAFASIAGGSPEFARALASFAAIRTGNNFLRRSSPFADLPSAAIEALAAKLEAVSFQDGVVLMREGERGDDAYLVRAGEVEIVRGDRRLARLGSGSFVGEVSALTGTSRTATVRALGTVDTFRLRGSEVRSVVKRHRDLVRRLETTMQSRHIPTRAGEAVLSPAPDDPMAVLLRDRDGSTYIRVTKEALAIYEDIDGERTLRDLTMLHFARTGALDPASVFATIATLQAAGFVSAPRIASDEPDARLLRVLDAILAPRYELRSADGVAAALHRAIGWAFTGAGAVTAVVVGLVGAVALAFDFRQSSPGEFGIAGLLVAFVGLLVAGVGHELAHAVAAKAEGRRVGKAGIGLLWLTPVVYLDTSDAWLLPARRRIRVNAAGPLFNFAFAGVCGLAALTLTGRAQDVAIWLAVLNWVSVAFNLSPLLEFDGYYVLEDLANVNALRRKSLRFVFRDLAARPRGPRTRLERGYILYAVAAVAYVVGMSVVVLAGVPGVVDGVFRGRLAPELIPIAGLGLALTLAALLVGPFLGEVIAARAAAD